MLPLFAPQLHGQTIDQLLEDGIICYNEEYFNEAEELLRQASILAVEQKNEYAHLQAIIWISECAFQHQAYETFQQLSYQAKEIAEERFSKDILYFTILQNIGVSHSYLGRFDLQRKYYFQALFFVKSNFPDDTKMLADAFYNIAAVYYRTFTLDSALIWFDSTLTLAQKIGYDELEAQIYLNRGVIYSRHNDFNQAIKEQTKALQFTRNTNEKILCQTHLSNYYDIIGQKEMALQHLNIALQLVRSERTHQQYHAMVELNACKIFLQQQKNNSFLETWHNLDQWLPKEDVNFEEDNKRALNLIAQYHIKEKQYQQAKISLDEALLENNQKEYPETKTWSLKLYAQLLSEQGEFELGLHKIQEALYIITPAFQQKNSGKTVFDITDIDTNPTPKEIEVFEQSLELLANKMKILLEWSKKSESDHQLHQALFVFECVDSFLTLNRRQLKSRQSKTTLASLIQPFFHTSLDLFYELYQQDNDPKWIQKAFRVMERSRALIISENLIKQSALIANIPDNLRLKEKKIAQQSDHLNFLIKQSETIAAVDKKKDEWYQELYLVEKEWSELLNHFAETYKNYYAQNYQLAFSTIEDVQQKLINDNEVILSFMDLNNYLYCVGIDQSSVFFKKLPLKQSLEDQIIALRNSIKGHSRSFYDQSRQLYEQILSPIADKISQKDLIIMPDGWLWKLPFAALVTKLNGSSKASEFLIQQTNIRYGHAAHSSILLQEQKNDALYKYNCTAFAPFCYQGQEDSNEMLAVLPASLNEVNAIKKIFPDDGFKLYLDQQANANNFLDGIQSSQIIHVSSHTKINDYYPGLSSLYFYQTQDKERDNQIHVYDLYQKEMHAELAVLSTCRSGDDKIEKGEGLAGLSRVFAMAGCPNIIVSQWALNDQSSAKIMIDFYENLLNGQKKNNALVNAQRNYLKECDPLESHPYYWAALIQIGDNKEIDFSLVEPMVKINYLVLISSLLFLLFMGLLFFYKKQ